MTTLLIFVIFNMNKKILYILRGVPGSGKSTYANEIMSNLRDRIGEHYEADMYFMDNGKYNWNADKLYFAHKPLPKSSRPAPIGKPFSEKAD